MKRKFSLIIGNLMMAIGMLTMIASLGYTIFSHVFSLDFPASFSEASLMGVFVGALVWLAGAGLSGKERVEDRYYWLRNFDKRCRRRHP